MPPYLPLCAPCRRIPRGLASLLVAVLFLLSPGVTYAQTAPPPAFQPVVRWFFAEGSTQPPFETWFVVLNPTNQSANLRFIFQLQGGGTVAHDFTVGPRARFSLWANPILPNQAFSTRLDADQPVYAERSMYVGFDGTVVPGVPRPHRLWLFAEGSTQPPFHTWLLLQNPNDQPATATLTYLRDTGGPVTQTVALPPTARVSIFVNQVLPNAAFSTRIESDLPIVAERAMYRFPGNAALAKAGVTAPSRTWFFAEGRTRPYLPSPRPGPVDTWLLLQNPHPQPVRVWVTLFSAEDRAPMPLFFTLPPQSRRSFFLNHLVGDGFASFGMRVEAEAEIVAERSIFWGPEPRGAYSAVGAPALATTWYLAEGTELPFPTFIHILNPNDRPAEGTIDFLLQDGQVITRSFGVLPQRKWSISVRDYLRHDLYGVSAVVKTSVPTVVERTMFIRDQELVGAHNTVGIPHP